MRAAVSRRVAAARHWMARARGSVRLRVTLMAAGLFAVTLAVAAFGLLRALEDDLVDDVRSAAIATLRTRVAQVVNDGVPADAVPVASASGEAFRLPGPGQQVVLFVRDAASPPSPCQAPPSTTVVADGCGGVAVSGEATGSDGARYDVVYAGDVPIAQARLLGINGDPGDYTVSSVSAGDVTLATASPLDSVRDTIATTKRLLWFAGPALVALVAGLAWLLAGRALRPVHAVTSRVAAIGSRSLHERVPVPASGDEIAELASTMNGMLARLEAASTTNRRLVSDASHELRTPVAVMRTELEVARRSPTTDWNGTSTVLLGELDRLQGLVDDLLMLARGDERAYARTPFSIADVARDVGARPRRVPVEVSVGPDVDPVVGDQLAVERAIDHLVANGARHAASMVRTEVAVAGDDVVIVVDDDGPGIAPAKRADVVRRFVRLDDGRARDGGGAGLGLAVTSDVATAHGGRLEIGDAPLGGARLTLVLPRARP